MTVKKNLAASRSHSMRSIAYIRMYYDTALHFVNIMGYTCKYCGAIISPGSYIDPAVTFFFPRGIHIQYTIAIRDKCSDVLLTILCIRHAETGSMCSRVQTSIGHAEPRFIYPLSFSRCLYQTILDNARHTWLTVESSTLRAAQLLTLPVDKAESCVDFRFIALDKPKNALEMSASGPQQPRE